MGMQQKVRTLSSGIPAGLKFQYDEDNGVEFILLQDVPYEMEDIIWRWILAVAPNPKDLTTASDLFIEMEQGLALTLTGWRYFVSWMLNALEEKQRTIDFSEKAKAAWKARALD